MAQFSGCERERLLRYFSSSSLKVAKRKNGAGSFLIGALLLLPVWYVSRVPTIDLYVGLAAAVAAVAGIALLLRSIIAMTREY